MTDQITIGHPEIAIHLRSHPRAKRYGLLISPKDGTVWLTIPKGGNLQTATEFAQSKQTWIRQHQAKYSDRAEVLNFGDVIEIWGKPIAIEKTSGARTRFDGDVIFVPGPAQNIGPRIKALLKDQARAFLVSETDEFARDIGRSLGKISLRDTSSRWGSCTSKGDIMYSLRLAMAPPEVASYVAAHEVCHLIEMNHSQAFWDLVQEICPDYKTQKAWLKQHGARLQSVPLN